MSDLSILQLILQGGTGVAVIYVVIIFLRYLSAERKDRATERESFILTIRDRDKEQQENLSKVVNAIEVNNKSLTHHDEMNGIAHKEASERMAAVACVQTETLKQLKKMNRSGGK
jgi:hypothetical protein